MIILIIGVIVFFGMHLIPTTNVKIKLIDRIGEEKYKGFFL